MRPRVELRARSLLSEGRAMTKYDLAELAHCDQRTAQRVLSKLEGIYVERWVPVYQQMIPEYRLGYCKDAPKPKGMTPTQRSRKRRKDPEHRIQEAMQKRAKRFIERQNSIVNNLRNGDTYALLCGNCSTEQGGQVNYPLP